MTGQRAWREAGRPRPPLRPSAEPATLATLRPPCAPQPPSAVFTLRSASRSLLSPSTCCCISTMLEPSCPTEPSAPPCSPAFFMTSPSWASALRCPSEPHRYPAPKMPATATMRSPRPIRPWSISSSLRVSHALALLRDVVDQQVLAQPIRAGVERAPLVDARHALDEGAQARAVVEHERVDDDAAAGDALDLLERLLRGAHRDAAEGQRPLAVEPPAQEVRRRLAVGDDEGVLVVARVAGEEVGGLAEPVLQVGERVAHVPARLGQVAELELHGAGEEADDREVVARVAGADQALHRHRDLLGGGEAPLPRHRPAHVEEEDGRAGGGVRGGVHLEVLGVHVERRARAPGERLLQGAHQIEHQRVAVLVALGLLGAKVDRAAVVGLVAPGPVAEQPLVDVAQRELPDLAHALRREVGASLALRHVARVDEQDHDLLQELEVARRLRPEERAQALEVDRLEVPREQRLLEALQALHLAHQLDRLAVGERLRALEEFAVAPLEVLEVTDVVQLLEQVR